MTFDTGAGTKAQKESVPTPKLQKYAYIDILRGLAILAVVAVHSGQHVQDLNALVAAVFNYGQLGVQLFFVASAITLCLSSSQRSEASPVSFYMRRFFRIAPLFYLAILFYFLWRVLLQYHDHGVFAVPDGYSIRGILETVFFVHGFDPKSYNFVVPGGWSIAAEMSFYAVFPLLYLVQCKYRKGKFLAFSVFVFIASLLVKTMLIYGVQQKLVEKGYLHTFVLEYDFLDKSLLSQINVFLIGIACYQYISAEGNVRRSSSKMVALSIPLMILSGFLLNSKSYTHTPFTGLLYPVLSAIAFALISMRLSAVEEFKSHASRLLIKAGQLSFSMYILHFFILDIVDFIFDRSIYAFIQTPELRLALLYPAALLLTFFLSKITYGKIEKRGIEAGSKLIRKIEQRRQRKGAETALADVAVKR